MYPILNCLAFATALFLIGCGRDSSNSTTENEDHESAITLDEQENRARKVYAVRSQDVHKDIVSGSPEYPLVRELLKIGEKSRHFKRFKHPKGYKTAPVHCLVVYSNEREKERGEGVAFLAHFDPERIIETQSHGARKLPEEVHRTMVQIWTKIRGETKKGISQKTPEP